MTATPIGASPGGAPVLVALFTTAELCRRRTSLAALAPTVLILAFGATISPPPVIAVWGFGAYARLRRALEREQLARIAVHEHASLSVLLKLGLRNRVQVVVFAYEHGIIVAGDPAEPM